MHFLTHENPYGRSLSLRRHTYIYLDPLIQLQRKIIRVITFSQYLAHTDDLLVQLQILPFKKLVIHRIGLQMFKNNLGYILKAVESLFITNSDIHKYNTIEIKIKCALLMVSMNSCIGSFHVRSPNA